MITKTDLSKAGGWTQGCKKCRAMKEGDHSRTNLAHSAECRARVAEILADDVGFQTKMRKAHERMEGERLPLEPSPKVQVGGSSSSGSVPVETPAHSSSKEKDVVMDSADVDIPLADGTHATAIESHLCQSQSQVQREPEIMMKSVKTGWRKKSLQLHPLVFKEGSGSAVAAAPAQVAVV